MTKTFFCTLKLIKNAENAWFVILNVDVNSSYNNIKYRYDISSGCRDNLSTQLIGTINYKNNSTLYQRFYK